MPDQTPTQDSASRRAVEALRTALKAGKAQEAANAFSEAIEAGVVPRDGQAVHWLVSKLGKPLASKLVEGYVHFACFYCTKGRMQCEPCAGRGTTLEGMPCETCLGTRLQRCDFCDGSGWVTINFVPEGIRPLVIRNRASLALRRASALLAEPVAKPTAENAAKVVKRCHVLMLNLDRQTGVFENVLTAVRQLPASDDTGSRTLQVLMGKCVLLASRVEARQGEILRMLAGAHRRMAEQNDHGRDRLLKAATFFETLVDPARTFAGTGLAHPFLHEAVVALRSEPAKTETQPGEAHESTGEHRKGSRNNPRQHG